MAYCVNISVNTEQDPMWEFKANELHSLVADNYIFIIYKSYSNRAHRGNNVMYQPLWLFLRKKIRTVCSWLFNVFCNALIFIFCSSLSLTSCDASSPIMIIITINIRTTRTTRITCCNAKRFSAGAGSSAIGVRGRDGKFESLNTT